MTCDGPDNLHSISCPWLTEFACPSLCSSQTAVAAASPSTLSKVKFDKLDHYDKFIVRFVCHFNCEEEDNVWHFNFEEEDVCNFNFEEEDNTWHFNFQEGGVECVSFNFEEEENVCHFNFEEDNVWHFNFEEEEVTFAYVRPNRPAGSKVMR